MASVVYVADRLRCRLPKSDRRVTDEGARTVKKTWSFLGRTVPAEVGTERATIAGAPHVLHDA